MPLEALVAFGGLTVAATGQYQAGQAAKEQGERQAAWNEYNARLAEKEATEAQAAAAGEERKFRKGARRLKSKQRALYAKAGVKEAGTPERFMEEQSIEIEEDALQIRRSGQLGYQRYSAEAALERIAGKSALLRGKASQRAARWRMASTGIQGFGRISSTF